MDECDGLLATGMERDYKTPTHTKLKSFRDPSSCREPSSIETSYYSYSYDSQSRSHDDSSTEQRFCCCFKSRCPGITVEPIILIYTLSLCILQYMARDYLAVDITHQVTETNASITQGMGNTTAVEDLISEFHEVDLAYILRVLGLYLPGIVIAFFIGAVSDTYGRRVVLFFPSAGILLHCMITLTVVWVGLPSWILLVGSFLDGFSGGPCILTAGVFGYLSHITTRDHRSIRFYVLAVMTWISTYLSKIIETYSGPVGSNVRIYILLATCTALILNLFLIRYAIQEPAAQHPDRNILDCDNLLMTVRVFQEHTTRGTVWKLRALILVVLLLASSVDEPEGLYLLALRSKYSDWETAIQSDVEMYFSSMLLLVSLIPLCLLWLTTKKVSDYVYILAGLVSALCVKIWQLTPLENGGIIDLVYAGLGFMTSVPIPLIRSALSKVARQRDQGAVAAGVSIAQQAGFVVASFVMTLNYITSTLIVGSVLVVLALVITSYVYWRAKSEYKRREFEAGLMTGLRGYTPIL